MKTVAVDTGGTFTDMVVLDHDSLEIQIVKVPSTPSDPGHAILDALGEALHGKVSSQQIESLIHGTTVGTNILAQGKGGARVGLLLTQGFSGIDTVWQIPRMGEELCNIYVEKTPTVDPWLLEEVRERVDAKGNVKMPLDVRQALEAVRRLHAKGAESIAVVLLFSFLNDRHERAIGELIRREFPAVSVSLSTEILPQIREFSRMSTTVANARLAPAMTSYLTGLKTRLRESGIATEQLYIMQSNGGVANIASVVPITTLLSGPCAATQAGIQIATAAGYANMVSLDMGGTSTDIALGENGHVLEQGSVVVNDWEIAVPMLRINTIGAGGGTLARLDSGGALQVGPDSAGADPGPVCYDKGGTDPTVTDANVVLGFLHPEYLLGGRVKISKARASEAIAALGERLGLDPMRTAEGIIRIINAKMEEGIREVSTEHGYDLRDFVLVAFGGAGPIHAGRLAADLGMTKAIVPAAPGVSSALGLIMADLRRDYIRSELRAFDATSAAHLNEMLKALQDQALAEARRDGFAAGRIRFECFVDLRYQGQGYELTIPASRGEPLAPAELGALRERFDQTHDRQFGHSAPGEPVEIVNYRVRATVDSPKYPMKQYPPADKGVETAVTGRRDVCFDSAASLVSCPIYDRGLLAPGHRIEGPAIVDQFDSTTVIYPRQIAEVGRFGSLIITVS
jgi:N-methylhydantoinase A